MAGALRPGISYSAVSYSGRVGPVRASSRAQSTEDGTPGDVPLGNWRPGPSPPDCEEDPHFPDGMRLPSSARPWSFLTLYFSPSPPPFAPRETLKTGATERGSPTNKCATSRRFGWFVDSRSISASVDPFSIFRDKIMTTGTVFFWPHDHSSAVDGHRFAETYPSFSDASLHSHLRAWHPLRTCRLFQEGGQVARCCGMLCIQRYTARL